MEEIKNTTITIDLSEYKQLNQDIAILRGENEILKKNINMNSSLSNESISINNNSNHQDNQGQEAKEEIAQIFK